MCILLSEHLLCKYSRDTFRASIMKEEILGFTTENALTRLCEDIERLLYTEEIKFSKQK